MLAQENEIVVCPGVYDGFTARLALNAGFKILYMVPKPGHFMVKMPETDLRRQAQAQQCHASE
jgi:2-methylisocitrate lyase-like PEP mutase family enzyme